MATAPTLAVFILITISTVLATDTPVTESPTVTSPETNTTMATNVTSEPPCPEFDTVYSERGDDAVNICWTMKGNWTYGNATYQIHFRLQNTSTVTVQHNESGNCQVVNYDVIALNVDEAIEYNVTVTWGACNATSKSDSTTRHSPPPWPDPLANNKAFAANAALALGVISALLVLAVVVYSRCRSKKRSMEL